MSVDVLVEPFHEWIVDVSQIKGGRPDIAGVTYVEDPLPYIERKLLTVNAGHSAIAYLGYARGKGTIRAALEHGLLIWAPAARLEKLIRIEGREHLDACLGQPVILLAPHFIGLDMGGVRLSTEIKVASMYSRSRSPVADHYLLKSRTRFTEATLASRHDGIRPLIKIIQSGLPFYYLPDQDYGRRESIFVPFFGIAAATVPALSRLAKVTGAKVVPAVTRQLPGGQGYVLQFYPAWENFPSGDIEADTRRMNAFIEERIREIPEQYLWTHRRFKTRPAGEAGGGVRGRASD